MVRTPMWQCDLAKKTGSLGWFARGSQFDQISLRGVITGLFGGVLAKTQFVQNAKTQFENTKTQFENTKTQFENAKTQFEN